MSTPCAIFAKSTLFSAETYRKTRFSAGYSNFFALFAADITKFMYHYDYRTVKMNNVNYASYTVNLY